MDIELLNTTTKAYSQKVVSDYPNTGFYSWTVSLDATGFEPTTDYVLDVTESGGLGVGDRSGGFSIISE